MDAAGQQATRHIAGGITRKGNSATVRPTTGTLLLRSSEVRSEPALRSYRRLLVGKTRTLHDCDVPVISTGLRYVGHGRRTPIRSSAAQGNAPWLWPVLVPQFCALALLVRDRRVPIQAPLLLDRGRSPR